MNRVLTTALLVSAATAALLGFGAAPAAAKTPCWKVLINDWYDGRIDGTYPRKCYQDALRNAPLDVQAYSSLKEDLDRALAVAIHKHLKTVPAGQPGRGGEQKKSSTPPVVAGKPPTGKGKAGGGKTTKPIPKGPGVVHHPDIVPNSSDQGPVGDLLASGSPKKADQVPLPLIILGAVALLLVAAGAAGAVAKRLQARRVPLPPPEPRP